MEITLPAFIFMINIIGSTFSNDISSKELYCLAANSYFESRGESFDGKIAVAQVVMNRVKSKHYPNTICEVVQQGPIRESWKTRKITGLPEEERIYYPIKNRCQFSWYCDGASDIIPINRKSGEVNTITTAMWRDCVFAAVLVSTNKVKSLVGPSTHYYAYKKVTPNWPSLSEYTVVDNHRFMYKKGNY
tara:strand:- start:134 stop:700 length:567 start_codon:yes stop_codon:yes gene_type:complete